MSPEVKARIQRMRDMAQKLQSASVISNPVVHDFLRKGQGPADILWLIKQLESTEGTSDEGASIDYVYHNQRILDQVRKLLNVDSNDKVVGAVEDLIYKQPVTEETTLTSQEIKSLEEDGGVDVEGCRNSCDDNFGDSSCCAEENDTKKD